MSLAWLQDNDDSPTPSGPGSPIERQHMLPSSSKPPIRSASYKSLSVSPLNPSFPGPQFISPFARSASHQSIQSFTRIPSEESRALATHPSSNANTPRTALILYRRAEPTDDPLSLPLPHLPGTRTSTISIAESLFSLSLSSDSKYPSGAPNQGHHGLVAYAYDPALDQGPDEEDALHDPATKFVKSRGPASWRGCKNITALILMVVALLALFVAYPIVSFYHNNGRNSLIVGNTRINATGQAEALEGEVQVKPRSQVLLAPSLRIIDPATPRDVLSHTDRDGIRYSLVFSDEFETDGRTFNKDDDLTWETVHDTSRHPTTRTPSTSTSATITTRDGFLVVDLPSSSDDKSHDVTSNTKLDHLMEKGMPILRPKTPLCLHEGFVELGVLQTPESDSPIRSYWINTSGRRTFTRGEYDTNRSRGRKRRKQIQKTQTRVVQTMVVRMDIVDSRDTPTPSIAKIDYVRYYQRIDADRQADSVCGSVVGLEVLVALDEVP